MMSVMFADESVSEAVYMGSDVQVADVQGVVLDELAAGRDIVPHQQGEEGVGLGGVVDRDLEEAALLGVHGGLEELLRVHFPEALVALDGEALAAVGPDLRDDVEGGRELRLGLALLARVLGDDVAGLLG